MQFILVHMLYSVKDEDILSTDVHHSVMGVLSTALAFLWYQYGPQNWLGGCSGMLKVNVGDCYLLTFYFIVCAGS